MPPIKPPQPIVAQQARPINRPPIANAKPGSNPPLTKTATSVAKPASIDKKTLVNFEQSGPDANPTIKVKSKKGTLLFAAKSFAAAEAWVNAAAIDKLSS